MLGCPRSATCNPFSTERNVCVPWGRIRILAHRHVGVESKLSPTNANEQRTRPRWVSADMGGESWSRRRECQPKVVHNRMYNMPQDLETMRKEKIRGENKSPSRPLWYGTARVRDPFLSGLSLSLTSSFLNFTLTFLGYFPEEAMATAHTCKSTNTLRSYVCVYLCTYLPTSMPTNNKRGEIPTNHRCRSVGSQEENEIGKSREVCR